MPGFGSSVFNTNANEAIVSLFNAGQQQVKGAAIFATFNDIYTLAPSIRDYPFLAMIRDEATAYLYTGS